jgi:hypothetical protein
LANNKHNNTGRHFDCTLELPVEPVEHAIAKILAFHSLMSRPVDSARNENVPEGSRRDSMVYTAPLTVPSSQDFCSFGMDDGWHKERHNTSVPAQSNSLL